MDKEQIEKLTQEEASEVWGFFSDYLNLDPDDIHVKILKTYLRAKMLHVYYEGQHAGIKKLGKLMNEEHTNE